MRPASLGGLLALTLVGSAVVGTAATAQTETKPAKPASSTTKKAPSKLTSVVKKLVDTAATAAAGLAVDTLLGEKGRAVAGSLTGTVPGAGGSCPAGTVAMPTNPAGAAALAGGQASVGAAVVGIAKKALKSKATTEAAAQAVGTAPVDATAGLVCQSVPAQGAMPGTGGMAGMAVPGAPTGMPGGMSALAAVTPVGMAVAAAPVASHAVKGIKHMFGGKPMDKIAVLRELGKGKVELKGVKFIEGTAELEPGFEPVFAAVGEAIPLAEGTYLLYVAPEQAGKDTPPDTALARKRLEKVWAALLVNGVSDQRVIATLSLPAELTSGRKPAKRGDARVELIRLTTQP
jgi:hypothetical protein